MINSIMKGFNTQPPEGGCSRVVVDKGLFLIVSTHSHPKVAASWTLGHYTEETVFQHTATRRWLLPI